jgi:diketogulonate reductase-like aldo/keto reductase
LTSFEQIHPLCQQRPIVEWCIQRSIVIEAYCPLLQGALDQPVFVALAAKHTRSVAQVLLRWSLQKGWVIVVCVLWVTSWPTTRFVPLPKSVTPERIVANAQLFDFALDEEDMKKLDALDKGADGAVSWNPVDFL